MTYYIHGKDLLFAYGEANRTEYRMYFYKNQLIQLLIDKPGQKRETYTQYYKKWGEFSSNDEMSYKYLYLENQARKLMGTYKKTPTDQLPGDEMILITKITGNSIVYHYENRCGSDGSICSISKKAYRAKLSTNCTVRDWSDSPNSSVRRTLQWLKNNISGEYLGCDVMVKVQGNVITEITLPYFA